MERMQRWREPAVLVVTAALLLRLVLVAVFAATSARLGLDRPADSAFLASRQLSEPLIFVVLAALVACCHLRPPSRHARALTALALAVAGLAVLLAVVLALVGYRAYTPPFSQLDFAERLVDLVVPLLAVATLGVLLQQPRPHSDPAPAPALARARQQEEEAAPPEEPQPDPELQPTWQPDVAAGAAWYTAGDAASGRPAAGWGSPQSSSGWQPTPQLPPATVEPTAGEPRTDRRPEDGRHEGGRHEGGAPRS
jgi:hypothetical protein